MAMRSQRFGVQNRDGARSAEWVVMWKTNSSDVYIATRTLGHSMKASLHEMGQCHVRGPDPQDWVGAGNPPRFLELWNIDPASNFEFPFAIVIPEQELRHGPWVAHRDRGTMWLQASQGMGVEIGFFLVRAHGDLSVSLAAAGWESGIVDSLLPDGRRLVVVAAYPKILKEKLAELEANRRRIGAFIAGNKIAAQNPRLIFLAGTDDHGTRKFVEAAGNEA